MTGFNGSPDNRRIQKLPLWKRATDISLCLLTLPFLAVGALCISVIMRVVSPGPVFFLQERVGYQGRRFRIYKFRTMHVCANTHTHQEYFKQLMQSNTPMTKLDLRNDTRLIPGGWLLRATGVDELPQLINVLLGDMSLVGPRPCITTEYENYLPYQLERFSAVPGLTGLWQVSGKNRTTFEEMIRLDIKYARNLSFALDLKIILTTVPALCRQVGDTVRARPRIAVSARIPKTAPNTTGR